MSTLHASPKSQRKGGVPKSALRIIPPRQDRILETQHCVRGPPVSEAVPTCMHAWRGITCVTVRTRVLQLASILLAETCLNYNYGPGPGLTGRNVDYIPGRKYMIHPVASSLTPYSRPRYLPALTRSYSLALVLRNNSGAGKHLYPCTLGGETIVERSYPGETIAGRSSRGQSGGYRRRFR